MPRWFGIATPMLWLNPLPSRLGNTKLWWLFYSSRWWGLPDYSWRNGEDIFVDETFIHHAENSTAEDRL